MQSLADSVASSPASSSAPSVLEGFEGAVFDLGGFCVRVLGFRAASGFGCLDHG